MERLPKSILEKLNFENNTQFFKSVKQLCKKFSRTDKQIYDDLKYYGLYDFEKQYFNIKRSSDSPDLSIENERFEHLLHDNNIEYITEFPLGAYFYDFKVGNILIEINPSWTHNSSYNVTTSRKKVNKLSTDYHYNKTKFAIDNGYLVINVYEWNDVQNILPILTGDIKVKQVYKGIEEHKVLMKSSSKFKSFILSDDGKILQEAECSIFDDGYELLIV